jgi:hypothetical protein
MKISRILIVIAFCAATISARAGNELTDKAEGRTI